MDKPRLIKDPRVDKILARYPKAVQVKLARLRKLIFDTALETTGIDCIEETLKWNEPAYLVKQGSTIRIDWKKKTPGQYAIYFQCTSLLVPTFKMVFGNRFNYEGNRAIIFQVNEKVPMAELKKCIAAGLTYHKVKHLPLLGL